MIFSNRGKKEADRVIKDIYNKKSDFWVKEGQKRSLKLFKDITKRVPAYEDFLKKNKINPRKINTWVDFQSVPPMDKKKYLKQYLLKKYCWDGTLAKPLVFTATSGSTGEPFYFPRGEQLDWQYSIFLETYFKNSSIKSGSTLVIVGFGMGVWIGGLITYKAFEMLALRNNYPVSIITPGVNKLEIIHALKKLAPYFNQVILVSYPPFMKDIIDEAINEGIDFKKINLRLLLAAESFTENFRDYLTEKTNIKNVLLDTANIYGSADIGAMASETPLAILIRRLAINNKNLFNDIFGQIQKTPTLAQYNPLFINFEALNGEILLTGNNAIPLVRYAIGDNGGVLTFTEIKEKFKKHNINLKKEATRAGIKDKMYELPFVYIYERNDFSVKLYGAIIFPEPIREALLDNSVKELVTGKFTIVTKIDKELNQYLEINIELKKNIKTPRKNLITVISNLIVRKLLEKNSEYKNNYIIISKKVVPRLIFWPYEHPQYFKPGIKQKWIKKK